MNEVSFRLAYDSFTGKPSATSIYFTDEQGVEWLVPVGQGHRFEDQFDAFLTDGGIVTQ